MKLANPFRYVAPISQYFGENPQIYSRFRMDGHNGVDFAIPENTELLSVFEGEVTQVGYDPTGYGNFIRLQSAEGYEVLYAHLNTIFVHEKDSLPAGQKIGLSGNTGFSTGPHLHFGMRLITNGIVQDYRNGFYGYIDPLPFWNEYGEEQEETFHGSAPEIPEEKEPKQQEKVELPAKEQPSEWAQEGYDFVTEEGISNGERPRDYISREEFWLTLYRFAEVVDMDEDLREDDIEAVDFSKLALDQRPSEWAEFSYFWVKALEISNGARPKEYISREEIWVMLSRFLSDQTEFVRQGVEAEERASSWAIPAQSWVMANGISNGERPHDFISREEVWLTLSRLSEKI